MALEALEQQVIREPQEALEPQELQEALEALAELEELEAQVTGKLRVAAKTKSNLYRNLSTVRENV